MPSLPEFGIARSRPSFPRWLLLLVALNLLARIPLCWDPATVDNDGAEYLAIARHLRATGEYATDLKWQFYTDDPVRHAAWADRPPLYPTLAALTQQALPFLDPTAAARLGNALLACAALVLCAWYLRRLYGDTVALLAVGFVFLLPHTLKWTTQPMTETVTLLLSFAALHLWLVGSGPGVRTGVRRLIPFAVGALSGLAYLARPTGALLAVVFVLDALRRRKESGAMGRLAGVGVGFGVTALPYHLLLWKLYGNPLHSALGFTFAVQTYYEVSYYGYGAPRPTLAGFLAGHWTAIPGLVLHQVWRHVQLLVPQLLPFLPFASRLRRADMARDRWPAWAMVAALALAHTVTWSAWGSSRYFLACLPIVVAGLLEAAERIGVDAPGWTGAYRRALPVVTGLGLLLALANFYVTAMRPDRGLSSLPAWKDAAREVAGARLIASDRPSILNLLLETPAVRLPRTTDTALLQRFIAEYRPEALVLFADEPAEEPMAAAWRAGRLPRGWSLTVDRGILLIAKPHTLAPP